jgi:hypothetical protein
MLPPLQLLVQLPLSSWAHHCPLAAQALQRLLSLLLLLLLVLRSSGQAANR